MTTNENLNLLPLQTRVTHFDGGASTHGKGTVVAYNGVKPNRYALDHLTEVAEAAIPLGLGDALVSSLYDGERCPYVVHFDPSERYPQGYKDVYEASSINEIHSQ